MLEEPLFTVRMWRTTGSAGIRADELGLRAVLDKKLGAVINSPARMPVLPVMRRLARERRFWADWLGIPGSRPKLRDHHRPANLPRVARTLAEPAGLVYVAADARRLHSFRPVRLEPPGVGC